MCPICSIPMCNLISFVDVILHSVHSASVERVGQGEVGGVTHRVTCTWWLLGLDVKVPWLGPGGPTLALAAWTGLGNATLTL